MLDHKSQIKDRQIEVSDKDIDLIFTDDNSIARLTLPSVSKLIDRKTDSLRISLPDIVSQDPFNLRQVYQNVYDKLSSKYEAYKDSKTFLVRLSNLESMRGENELSTPHLERAINIDNDHKTKKLLISSLLKNKDFESASKILISDKTAENKVFNNLAEAYLNLIKNDIDGCYGNLYESLKIEPENHKIRIFIGTLDLYRGDFGKAIFHYRVAEDDVLCSSPFYVNLAAAHLGNGSINKSLKSLRKALALNPLNQNAAIFLSDLTFNIGKPEDSIPYLEYFSTYEKQAEQVWDRLARAHYFFGKRVRSRKNLNAALESLKKQKKLSVTPSVMNNIGLAYWAMNQVKEAHTSLLESVRLSLAHEVVDYSAFHNMIAFLIEHGRYKDALRAIETAIKTDKSFFDSDLSHRLMLQHVVALEGAGYRGDAASTLQRYLTSNSLSADTKLDMYNHLIFYYSVVEENTSKLEELIPVIIGNLNSVDTDKIKIKSLSNRIYNNIAFSYLLMNKLDEAEIYISKISDLIHKDPYSTATLGMYHIRKGNRERGEYFYENAISIITNPRDKSRFRQRRDYEIGVFYYNSNEIDKALKFFSKASRHKFGFPEVTKQITDMRASTIRRLSKLD